MKTINKGKYFFFSVVILTVSIVIILILLNFNVHELLLFIILFISSLLSLHVYNFGKAAGMVSNLLHVGNIELESFDLLNLTFVLTRNNKKYEVVVFPSIDFYTFLDQIAYVNPIVATRLPYHLQIRVRIESIDRYEVSENIIDAMHKIRIKYPFFQTRPTSKLSEALSSRVHTLEKDISISDNIMYITLAKVSGNVYLVAFLHKHSTTDDFLRTFDFLDKLKGRIK